jgi:hypothetical protein
MRRSQNAVIASGAKQSIAPQVHCKRIDGLLRRYAPRNDVDGLFEISKDSARVGHYSAAVAFFSSSPRQRMISAASTG